MFFVESHAIFCVVNLWHCSSFLLPYYYLNIFVFYLSCLFLRKILFIRNCFFLIFMRFGQCPLHPLKFYRMLNAPFAILSRKRTWTNNSDKVQVDKKTKVCHSVKILARVKECVEECAIPMLLFAKRAWHFLFLLFHISSILNFNNWQFEKCNWEE